MANTLNLGTDGNWAIKEGALLGYNSESSNFKPLPFNFTRASTATYIAEDGLIKTAASGVPRIDFLDSTEGSLKLEPQRTNLIAQSEDFSQWIDAGTTTVLSNITNPSGGLQSYLLSAASSATNALRYDLSFSASTNYSYSLFFKAGTSQEVRMQIYDGSSFFRLAVNPLNNFEIIDQSGVNSYLIEDFTNGWKKVSINITTSASASSGYLQIYPDRTGNLNNVYLFGGQLEQGSYPTSYIPTEGSTATRIADACSQTPPDGIIGQTEGTVYFDVNISHILGNEAIGGINSGGYANHATIQRIENTIQFVRNSATQSGATIVTSSAITVGRYRLALAYKSGDIACFLNGTQVGTTQTQTFTNGTLNAVRISGDAIGALPFGDTYNQAKLYNTRLSNSELATLTTI